MERIGVSFNDNYSSNLTKIPKIYDVVLYDSAESVWEAYWGSDFEDNGGFGGFDGKGNEIEMSQKEVINNIKQAGLWGFVSGKDELHIWIDFKTADTIDILSMFSHELGHFQRPHKRDVMQEEMKAEHYSDMTRCAYSLFETIRAKLNS